MGNSIYEKGFTKNPNTKNVSKSDIDVLTIMLENIDKSIKEQNKFLADINSQLKRINNASNNYQQLQQAGELLTAEPLYDIKELDKHIEDAVEISIKKYFNENNDTSYNKKKKKKIKNDDKKHINPPQHRTVVRTVAIPDNFIEILRLFH